MFYEVFVAFYEQLWKKIQMKKGLFSDILLTWVHDVKAIPTKARADHHWRYELMKYQCLLLSMYDCIVQNTTILTIWLVQLCTVSVNEHTKKERNDIWLQRCLCCTSSVKLLWPELQLNVIIRSNCIKGYSSTDRCSEIYELQIHWYFLPFSIIHSLIAGWYFLAFAVCMCGHEHTCGTYTQQPIQQLWLLIRSVAPSGSRLHSVRCNLLLSSAFRVQVAWRVEKDLRAPKVPL